MEKGLKDMTLEELWRLFPIVLKEYTKEYQLWYQEEEEQIRHTVAAEKICRINHIGSTFVEGLLSKPTVDILLEVKQNTNIETIKNNLIKNGWILMNQQTEPFLTMVFNKGYTPNGFANKVFHLHLRYYGDWDELYFRDYLSENGTVAKEYGQLKRELGKRHEHNRDAYTEAKTEFIQKYTKIARETYSKRYQVEPLK